MAAPRRRSPTAAAALLALLLHGQRVLAQRAFGPLPRTDTSLKKMGWAVDHAKTAQPSVVDGKRPFVLLRGVSVSVPDADLRVLEAAVGGKKYFVQQEIGPIKIGVPPFDKINAWNLSTAAYRRILVVDADAMLLRRPLACSLRPAFRARRTLC